MPTAVTEELKAYDPSMDKQVDEFRGPHYFLSNASPSPIVFEGVRYPTVDHAFAAARTLNETERRRIAAIEKPTEAQREGRDLELRPDWDMVKEPIMLALVREKFQTSQSPSRLLGTGNATLINGNSRGDLTWGKDLKTGQGENKLGNILMQLRADLARGIDHSKLPEPSLPEVLPTVQPQGDNQHNDPKPQVTPGQESLVIEFNTTRETIAKKIAGMRYRVHENGDVSYSFADLHSRVFGGTAFTDHGPRVTIESKDPRAVKAAMQYAKESWGDHPVMLRISSGSGDAMLREAVNAGLNVKNPELQNRIKALREELSNARSGRNNLHPIRTSARENRENAVERAG